MDNQHIHRNIIEYKSVDLNKETSENLNLEINKKMCEDNSNITIKQEAESNDDDDDITFIAETQININLVKDEPNEERSTTKVNNTETNETCDVLEIKLETPLASPCNNAISNEMVSENIIDLISVPLINQYKDLNNYCIDFQSK